MRLDHTRWLDSRPITCRAVKYLGYKYIVFSYKSYQFKNDKDEPLTVGESEQLFNKVVIDWEYYYDKEKEDYVKYYKWIVKDQYFTESINFYSDHGQVFDCYHKTRKTHVEHVVKKIPSKWIGINNKGEIVATSWDDE